VAFLNPAEGFETLLVDDLLQGAAFLGLDENVGIDKIPGSGLGEKDPDRAFADCRHSDQHNVRIFLESYNFRHFFFESIRKKATDKKDSVFQVARSSGKTDPTCPMRTHFVAPALLRYSFCSMP
jgi:hypothetical protein